jgi:Cu+-exporting ATPase
MLLVGLLLAADVVLGTAAVPGLENWRSPWGFRLALFAAVFGGARILYHSLENVLAGKFGADLALTTACLAAIALGEHQTAGLVVFISLVGEAVEGFALQQAKRAVRRTFEQRPLVANLIRDGVEREIAAAELQAGDLVLVRPGDRIPADGRIVAGSSAFNESPFTGESFPVEKSIDDPVLAGSINLTTTTTVRVERTGDATTLAAMERLVRQAASRKMGCERLADRFARWFLPVVLAIAAVTLLAWRVKTGSWQSGWLPALGVLVVACPCPLILATPCAVMASLAWLARRGIVVKGSAALERLAAVDVFAFDKTGTISEGHLELGDIVPLSDLSADDLLRIAASAERPSGHPIARLLQKSAARRQLAVEWPQDFSSLAGIGVAAQVNLANAEPPLRRIAVGSERLVGRMGITISQAARDALSHLSAAGQTPLLVAIDDLLAGVIGVRESLRPESVDVFQALKRLGVRRLALLTGDRSPAAEAAARTLAVFDHVAAEQSPEDKARWIETTRGTGRRVAMVGDGVNDGPALAAADVGIAVCRSGSELAGEAGEILMLGDPLRPLPGLLRLSRALVENIRQSIQWFAFGVNGIGVLACSFGWLTPVTGALFHEVGSLLVMLNALRLLWFREDSRLGGGAVPALSSPPILSGQCPPYVLSPGRLLAGAILRWRMTVQLVACVILACWLCGQIVFVRANEAVVVLRAGRYHTTLQAGWSWRWPWPFERLVRLRPDEVQSVAVGFRRDKPEMRSAGEPPGDLEWTTPHDDPQYRGVPEESLYLTGDEVAVEVTADVQYRISDVTRFALAGALHPTETIRCAAESALRAAIAAELLENVLTERREEIEQRCLKQLQRRVADYQLGIDVLAFHWLDVHPPRPVVDAYRQVSDAWEQREQAVNEARALATRTLFGTAGEEAIRRLERRHADKTDRSNWSLSDDDWRMLTTPDVDGQRLLSGTAEAVLLTAEAAAQQQRQAAQGQADRLRALLDAAHHQPQLSRQHLYWMAVVEALAGKTFTLVDPALSGRRHLYLGDPPAGRFMPPPISPDPEK